MESAIKNLEVNKACGLNMCGIYAEYVADCLYKLLSLCITSFLVHGILPDSMLGVVLVPVIKDKSGRINAKDNYRPIALASIVSEVVENILWDRMSMFLVTRPNQFGFNFACYLDASKAFDRVKKNHSVLFEKLVRRGVPGYIVRILIFWYSNQQMCVK